MLTRQRAAQAHHEIRCVFHERPVVANARGGLEIEVDSCMDASLTKMAVQVSVQLMSIEELAECAQIFPEPRRRDRRILPSLPRRSRSAHVGGGSETGLARFPHLV